MLNLSIPCNWDNKEMLDILDINVDNRVIVNEIYGTIATDTLPHGRINSVVEKVNRDKALKFKQILDEKGVNFAYLLNAPIYQKNFSDIQKDLEWIFGEFKPNSITVTSLELMKQIRNYYNDVKINISTIAGIKKIEDIKKFEDIEPRKIVLHHDVNRNFKDLEKIIDYAKKNNIIIELMVNESCLRRCSKRSEHYSSISTGMDDHNYHIWCNNAKVKNPYNLLLANFILPQHIKYYADLGIKNFKITGRSKPHGWLYEVVKAYLNQNYSGNLMRLYATDPKLEVEKWIYLECSALSNFIHEFPKTELVKDEIKFCKDYINKLYENNHYIISSDFVKNVMKDGQLNGIVMEDIYRNAIE